MARVIAQTDARSAILKMVQRIVGRVSPDRIVLFGCHGRGDARADSDIDLLAVFSDVEDARARAR